MGMTLLKLDSLVCQVCAANHAPTELHNQQSLCYKIYFYQREGRYPTWEDAMAHCSIEVQTKWKEQLLPTILRWRIPTERIPYNGSLEPHNGESMDYEWIDFHDTFGAFCRANLSVAGTLVERGSGEHVLIGHVNELGGYCDDCLMLHSGTQITRYAVIWTQKG